MPRHILKHLLGVEQKVRHVGVPAEVTTTHLGRPFFQWLKTVSTEVGLNEKVANLLTDGFSTSKAEDWSFSGFTIFVGDME